MTSKSLIGIAGAHFVAAELCQRGYIATLTSRNTEGIDILASNQEGSKQVSIQVKTRSANQTGTKWILGEKQERLVSENLFYVFVKLKENNEKPDYYIIPSMHVASYIQTTHQSWLKEPGKNGKPHNDNSVRNFKLTADDLAKYRNNWKSLGLQQ